ELSRLHREPAGDPPSSDSCAFRASQLSASNSRNEPVCSCSSPDRTSTHFVICPAEPETGTGTSHVLAVRSELPVIREFPFGSKTIRPTSDRWANRGPICLQSLVSHKRALPSALAVAITRPLGL